MYMIVEVSQYVAVDSFSEARIEIKIVAALKTVYTGRLLLGGED